MTHNEIKLYADYDPDAPKHKLAYRAVCGGFTCTAATPEKALQRLHIIITTSAARSWTG